MPEQQNPPNAAPDLPSQAEAPPTLNWRRLDPEARLGFRTGRFTDTGLYLPLIIGLFLGALTYAGFFSIRESTVGQMFMNRGQIPYIITLLTTWSLGILWVKHTKLKLQRRALQLPIMPSAADYVLAPRTAPIILRRIYAMVDNPRHFVVLNRIEAALSNLRNIGRISDVSEILVTQAGNDEDHMVSSYSMVKGFVWAIPVLGFVGTVLGLSAAIGSFGGVLSRTEDLSNLTEALKDVTAGLSVAFDTTLLGLVASLFIQLLIVMLMKREEDFLHDCTEFCHIQVVGRLRLLDAEPAVAPNSQ